MSKRAAPPVPQVTAVLAIDPGLRTGWALWTPSQFSCGIADPGDSMDIMERWCNTHAGDEGALFVAESFHIGEETAKKDQVSMTWPLELIGVARYLCRLNDIRFVMQSPSQGKSFGTDEKLRTLGWWRPGAEDHHRDATRHLVRALHKRKAITL